MSDEFSEYKLLIMKEQETMAQSIKDISGILTLHLQEYNLFKGKIWGGVIAIPTFLSILIPLVSDKLK